MFLKGNFHFDKEITVFNVSRPSKRGDSIHKKTVRISPNMQCSSCESRIEDALGKLPGVSQVKANYGTGTLEVEYDPDLTGIKEIESALAALGYEKKSENTGLAYGIMLLLALIFMLGGVYGNVDLESMLNGNVTYLLLFTIGLVTSLHCTGMCGGLMLSQSISPEEGARRSAAFSTLAYHAGRVISLNQRVAVIRTVDPFFLS